MDLFVATHATMKPAIWATVALTSLDIDPAPPGTVGALTSSSHPVGSPSSNAVVQLDWSPAVDDFSGIRGYQFVWGPAPAWPDTSRWATAFMDLGDATHWTSPPSAPGDWYFSIVAIDNSRKPARNYASYGPITILAPEPANVTTTRPAGWYERLVPRPAQDATANNVPAPATLPPYPATTWLNLAVINDGELPAPQLDVAAYLDDFAAGSFSTLYVAPGSDRRWNNTSPILCPPGRHTLWMMADPQNLIYERDEFDNVYGLPWVWEPPLLGPDHTAPVLGRPGLATAGWGALPGPITIYAYNADGFRLHSYAGFHAASLRATDNSADYDLRLYAPASGPTYGFLNYDAWSTEPAGALDVVLCNSAAGGVRDYDLGVLNIVGGTSANYELKTYRAGAAAIGDSVPVPLAANENLFLRQFWVSAADTGSLTVSLATDAAAGPWHLALFDPATVQAELAAAPYDTTTDAAGNCRLQFRPTHVGNHALVAHRDPAGGGQATAVVYEIERTPPDLARFTPPAWYASVVPRESNGPFISLPAPGILPRDLPVFVYGASTNLGPNGAPTTATGVEVDGTQAMQVSAPPLAAGATRLAELGTVSVGSGRHTLGFALDRNATLEELDEGNNRVAEQYVFAARLLDTRPFQVRTALPDRVGGFADVPLNHPAYYNCDGFQPNPGDALQADTGWILAGLMSPAGEDVDLRVHAAATSAGHRFRRGSRPVDLGRGAVGLRPGEPRLAPRPGGSRPGGHPLGVRLHGQRGRRLALPWRGSGKPQVFEGLRVPADWPARLFSVAIPPGNYAAEVQPRSGLADLGLSVFSPDGTHWALAKGDEGPNAGSWLAPAGEPEAAAFKAGSGGQVLIVVWKVGAADLPAGEQFDLVIRESTPSGTPPAVPGLGSVAITGMQPNPFNPRLEIHYNLPRGGTANLSVFDLRGHRVATLVDQAEAAGGHRIFWNGVDGQGRQVSSGVYFVHLRGPGGRDTAKVVLAR